MYTLEEVKQMLTLSINNPRYKSNEGKIELSIYELFKNQEIDKKEHDRLKLVLESKYKRLSADIGWAFDRLKLLQVKGWNYLNFNESQIRWILEARKTSAEFYAFVNSADYKKDGPKVKSYLNGLAMTMIDAAQEKSETFWDLYHELKWSYLKCLARDVVSRQDTEKIARLLLGVVKQEETILYEEWKKDPQNFKKLTAFGDTKDSDLGFEPVAVGVKLFELFTTDARAYGDYAADTSNKLEKWEIENKEEWPNPYYKYYKKIVKVYTTDLFSYNSMVNYAPIETYYYAKEKDKFGLMYTYSFKQIQEAMELAHSFYQHFPNSFLVEEFILRRMRIDITKMIKQDEVKQHFREELGFYLDLLFKYEVLTMQQFTEFKQMVRDKYGN